MLLNPKSHISLKREVLDKVFAKMNKMQREAVFTVNGPLLILAGAGSGKTTVLVNRIANMIYFGNAYNDENANDDLTDEEISELEGYLNGNDVPLDRLSGIIGREQIKPWSILAITFTNKAASELKERIFDMLGDAANDINAATFHSSCVRILRREIDKLGYASNFTIYDTDDSIRLIKDCMKALDISERTFPPRAVLTQISRAKDKLKGPEIFASEAGADYRLSEIAKIYTMYQDRMKEANAVDFDDIISLTVRLFEEYEDVLNHYQNWYKYVLVDEYQDTNHAQYKLISLLTKKHENLCVVGDDDQSIYKFRGANIENILSFEEQFEEAKVIKLEQNYRSTGTILSAANSIISNNKGRKGKNLWTDLGDGEKIDVLKTLDDKSEAQFVANRIASAVKEGGKYSDHAILYRTNAQSRAIEQSLVQNGIPHKIIGGQRFFERKEVKDILAYLSVINNEFDLLRLTRIINEPKRGIGNATIAALEELVFELRISPFDILRDAREYPTLSKRATPLTAFVTMMDEISEFADGDFGVLIDELVDRTGYTDSLKKHGFDGETRLDNIDELKSYVMDYQEENEDGTLGGLLEEVSLYTDQDSLEDASDYVVLMTIHSAKGLEFPNVFIVGMEENIFPSYRSVAEGDDEIEEERRLAYVAITRAKKKACITTASERWQFGKISRNTQSRFLREIPSELINYRDEAIRARVKKPKAEPVAEMGYLQREQIRREPKNEVKTPAKSYVEGERIKHNIFGEGKIIKATAMGNDTMVEVAFDSGSNKKIMANFAKLKKL